MSVTSKLDISYHTDDINDPLFYPDWLSNLSYTLIDHPLVTSQEVLEQYIANIPTMSWDPDVVEADGLENADLIDISVDPVTNMVNAEIILYWADQASYDNRDTFRGGPTVHFSNTIVANGNITMSNGNTEYLHPIRYLRYKFDKIQDSVYTHTYLG